MSALRVRWRRTKGRGDDGAVTIEMLLAAPLLFLFLLLVVAAGELVSARIALDGAAATAARAASVATNPAAATADAQASATSASGLGCVHLSVATNTADFVAGGSVGVTLTCSVPLSVFGGLHLPTSDTLTSTFSEPLDQYKSYTP